MAAAPQLGEHRAPVRGAHQLFADKHRVDAVPPQPFNITGALDAAFGDKENLRRHQRTQTAADLHIYLKAPEIAVVDADDPRSGPQSPLHLGLVMRLDKRRKSKLPGELREGTQLRVVEEGADQQHRRGSERPRRADHILVHDKILE